MVRFLGTFIVMVMILLGICITASAEKLTAQPGNGALILNLNNVNNGPMFLNLFKQGGCTTPTPAEFNADGYPMGRLTGTKPGCGVILNQNSGTANYVVKWAGAGAMQIGSTHVTVSDPDGCDTRSSSTLILMQTDPSKGCDVTFHELINPGSSTLVYFPVTVGGRTVTYSGFKNAVLVLQSNEAALEKCADIVCFDPNYLGTISSGRGAPLGDASVNPLAVRTLDLTRTSNGNISDFDAIFSPAALSYNGGSTKPGLWGGTICATSGTCSPNSRPNVYMGANSPNAAGYKGCTDGEQYQGIIADASVALPAPVLNVGNGRCVAQIGIIGNGKYALLIPGAATIPANSVATFVYSAVLKAWLYWSGTASSGFPPAALAALCNALHTDCWVQLSTYLNDASVIAYTKTMAHELRPGLKWFVEYSNEPFLHFTQQTTWMYLAGTALGFPKINGCWECVELDYYALRHYQIMQLIASTWTAAGRSMSDLVRVQVIALGTPPNNPNHNDFQWHLLQGGNLTLQANGTYCSGTGCTITTDYSKPGARPGDVNIDALSYASYFWGIMGGWYACGGAPAYYATALAQADNYAIGTATGNQALVNSALQFVDGDVRDANNVRCKGAINGQTIAYADTQYAQYDKMLASWPNIKGVYEYEGGIAEAAPIYGSINFINLGISSTPNCPTATSRPSVTLTTSRPGLVTWPGHVVWPYNEIVFSESGGAITAGTTYYSVIKKPNEGTFGISTQSGGGALAFTGGEISPQTITYKGVGDSAYCVDQEIIAMIEGYKHSPLSAKAITDAWNTFMSYGTSKAPAWYSLGLGGSAVGAGNAGAFPPQFQLILGSIYNLPYYQTFYGTAAWTQNHPALPYLLQGDGYRVPGALDDNDDTPVGLNKTA